MKCYSLAMSQMPSQQRKAVGTQPSVDAFIGLALSSHFLLLLSCQSECTMPRLQDRAVTQSLVIQMVLAVIVQ